jgi:hypothetical protein
MMTCWNLLKSALPNFSCAICSEFYLVGPPLLSNVWAVSLNLIFLD